MDATQAHVEGLVPFVHVHDVIRSTAFYELFGFDVRNTYDVDGRRVWCWLGAPPGAPPTQRRWRRQWGARAMLDNAYLVN